MSTIAQFSLAEYDRMLASGAFDRGKRRRLELIRGEIRQMTPIGPLHEDVVDRLNRCSGRNLPEEKVRVRVQNSVGLAELESAPEPDIAWVAERDYSRARPAAEDVLLVIEVADSSLPDDCGEKADLYAAAGIRDYWIVNLRRHLVEVRREPAPGGYGSVEQFTGDQEIRPLSFPEIVLRPSTLWPE